MLLSQYQVSSSKIVRPRAPCGARCMRHANTMWSTVCSAAPHSQFGKGVRPPSVHGRMESPNKSPQAIELNRSYLGKFHSDKAGTGPGYENKKPECILIILHAPSIVCPLGSVDVKFGKIVQKIPRSCHKWASRS